MNFVEGREFMHFNWKSIYLSSIFGAFILTLLGISKKVDFFIIGAIKLRIPYECFFVSFIGLFALITTIIWVKQILHPNRQD